MSQDKDQVIENHSYDGIEEYDNPLPVWWLITFFATIIFGFHYWLHYEIAGAGQTQKQELAEDLSVLAKLKSQKAPASETDADFERLAGNAAVLALGKSTFAAKCAVCHGDNLQGLIGPNLTDEYWLHGGTPMSMAAVIREGVSDKGMPSWGSVLSEDEVRGLAIFIDSKKGSAPPNPKPPQGDKVVHN